MKKPLVSREKGEGKRENGTQKKSFSLLPSALSLVGDRFSATR
jgi:hypothetical protein